MSDKRQFALGLGRAGTAAAIRESVSQAVRESTCSTFEMALAQMMKAVLQSTLDPFKDDWPHIIHSKPHLIEPQDYETVVLRDKSHYHNDPQRNMLLFPSDDVSVAEEQAPLRTTISATPPGANEEASSLFVRQCLRSYTGTCQLVNYKYKDYSESHIRLIREGKCKTSTDLPSQLYEVDVKVDGPGQENTIIRAISQSITKQGWLYKGPDSRHEAGIINFTRSFKKRYFYLKQQADTTYVLEFHKDDKKFDAKGTIFLDSAAAVNKSNDKRGRTAIEIQMQNTASYLLAADTEEEVDEWINTLKKVVQTNENNNLQSSRAKDGELSPSAKTPRDDCLMHPDLAKYGNETTSYLTQLRRDKRQELFHIYPELPKHDPIRQEENCEVFRDVLGTRFAVACDGFSTELKANIAEDQAEVKIDNPEPFFVSLCLFDAREGKRISANFHYDPNSKHLRALLPDNQRIDRSSQPVLRGVKEGWVSNPHKALFSVMKPHSDIYLVCRVDKILQGGISVYTEPYIKYQDAKTGTKVYRQMKSCAGRIGQYRMPFAWGVRPVFKPFTLGEVDVVSEFSFYKQESQRLSDEEVVKHLQDWKRPEKQSKWIPVPCRLKVHLEPFTGDAVARYTNTLTPSLIPVRPFSAPTQSATLEVEEFRPEDGESCFPFSTYSNSLYIYPKNLRYDGQKTFAKARNIACTIELRDSDDENKPSLCRLYGGYGNAFTNIITTPVLHHNATPDFYEEVKASLPVQLQKEHHVLFTFYHISCENRPGSRGATAKKRDTVESVVGYSWLPLIRDGKLNVGDVNLPVASSLPTGYMKHEQLGLGKGFNGPEIKWVDGGKQLFRCTLNLASTIYTKDPHVQNFFQHCQKMEESRTPANDVETSNKLKEMTRMDSRMSCASVAVVSTDPNELDLIINIKSLMCADVSTLIQFLPTILNQLFSLLPNTQSDDVAIQAVKVLIHVVGAVTDAGKDEILRSYVKYVFVHTSTSSDPQHRTLHEELAKTLTLTLRPTNSDNSVIVKFLQHSWFFLEILIKSMAQYLVGTGRIKKHRNERFVADYQYRLQTMIHTLLPQIMHKFREAPVETRLANKSLANFIKRSFTYMDRGFVFRMVNLYMESFNVGDPKVLHEYKFEFLRIICNHEHYIPLNLPVKKNHTTYKDLKHDYTLSDEFKRNHFLVGLLLDELKSALNETADIRHLAIKVVRNLLAKHAMDDRVAGRQHQGRIACLYLPLITIILENQHRFSPQDIKQPAPPPPPPTQNGDVPDGESGSLKKSASLTKTGSLPKSGSLPQHRSMMALDQASQSPNQRTHRREGSLSTANSPGAKNKDNNILSIISSTGVKFAPETKRLSSSNLSIASGSSMAEKDSGTPPGEDIERRDRSGSNRQLRRSSLPGGPSIRFDKLEFREIKDLLISFLYIVKNLPEDIILGWFNNSSENDVQDFFNILDLCLFYFRYQGKNKIIALSVIGDTRTAVTLPPRKAIQMYQQHGRSRSQYIENVNETVFHSTTPSDADALFRSLMEGNLATEIGLVALDVVCLYCFHFKDQLVYKHGDNAVMKKIFDIFISYLQTSQSEQLLKHVFGALREFINNIVLFHGDAAMCGRLCYEVLRSCNSSLQSTRSEACSLMYLLMRHNFEFSGGRSFTRVHLQVIIAVSQLVSDIRDLSNSFFTESLSIINSYASSDQAMEQTNFPIEVKDLTRRIRTVLMATAQMKEHERDPEMLIDLQYSLARSYASTPELRKTWLEAMARDHSKSENHSEAAHCYLHIAALVAEYLKRRETYPQGCSAFKRLSPNIEADECGIKDDSGMEDTQYSEDTLIELLEDCAKLFEKAERYEVLGHLYRLIIPVYEAKRNYQRMAEAYGRLHRACSKIVEVTKSGRRLLGQYYRVAFFGQPFEEEDGKQYIYKEPRVTSLTEICDRLRSLFSDKFGKDQVRLIQDSKRVNSSELDNKYAYIQVSYVTPYFDARELSDRPTEFERSNNVRRFMFETPFTREGDKARGGVQNQCLRRTVLTTSHSFPYVKKRVQVVYHQEFELTPIEVAIDAIMKKIEQLEEVVIMPEADMKKLQLRLQGSVSAQVNAGPMAYAEAFLRDPTKYPREKVTELRETFKKFVLTCNDALDLNAKLIKSEQVEYQESMRDNFDVMVDRLAEFIEDELLPVPESPASYYRGSHRSSLTVFNYISATGASSV